VRRTNLALLVAVPLTVFTGLFANTIGVDWLIDPAFVHAVVGLIIVALAPWKSVVVGSGLRRRRPGHRWSLVLLAMILMALMSGLIHATGTVSRVGPLTIMQVHIGSALIGLAILVQHYRMHPVKPRVVDLDRRALLRSLGLVAAAGVLVTGWERALDIVGAPGADRRFTGSHERGSGDPSAMPVTQWFDDRVQRIDPAEWRLDISGTIHDLASLGAIETEEFDALLDCTSGWYSVQTFRGVRLDRLIDASVWESVEVRSATGYARRFPTRDLDRLWLCFEMGGRPLSAGHGFPARLVAPERRGFWWVKWVVSITPSDRPWWVQSPFPLT
jgi:hypothetical protein